ncbi:MAG: DUF1572 family protein [Planctomycetes bacterium]|nr:DUF1572 family protein [Planctomycetota bacterium]
MTDDAARLARIVAAQFRRRLCDEQLPRIQRCLRLLGDQRVWTRPGRTGNSAGNLVLHLCGNTTQWIVAQFGGEADRRRRDAEFAADGGHTVEQLCSALERVYRRACDVVDDVSVATLLSPRTVQGYAESGLSAILHVLEHTSGHAGQIYAWTKQVTDVDLAFYDL